jgi:hypothetical protein
VKGGKVVGSLKNPGGVDYSKYRCPYDHIKKDCGHELIGPEGYEDSYSVWCACGFRGPVFCLDPNELKFRYTDKAKREHY